MLYRYLRLAAFVGEFIITYLVKSIVLGKGFYFIAGRF